MKIVLVLCSIGVALAQRPMPCQTPTQWEGRIHSFSPNTSSEILRGRMSYDELNSRFRILEEIEQSSTRDFYDVLYLHNEQKQYRVNLKTRKCNVTALREPFRPQGVPPFAQFDDEITIGGAGIPNEHVIAITFSGKFEDGIPFFGTVSSPDCVPIRSGYFSNTTGLHIQDYYDISIGIADPMVFIAPQECTIN